MVRRIWKVTEKSSKVTAKKLVEEINADKKIHPILVSEALYNKMVKDVKETINYIPDQNVKPQKNQISFYQKIFNKACKRYRCCSLCCSVLDDVIDRIKNGFHNHYLPLHQ